MAVLASQRVGRVLEPAGLVRVAAQDRHVGGGDAEQPAVAHGLHRAIQQLHRGAVGVQVDHVVLQGILEHQHPGVALRGLHLPLHPVVRDVLPHGVKRLAVDVVGVHLVDLGDLQRVAHRAQAGRGHRLENVQARCLPYGLGLLPGLRALGISTLFVLLLAPPFRLLLPPGVPHLHMLRVRVELFLSLLRERLNHSDGYVPVHDLGLVVKHVVLIGKQHTGLALPDLAHRAAHLVRPPIRFRPGASCE
mmetsp:Transcript_7216/g.26160  ORF Transcript_7216/g.26160 Transcript_7216/m.26160 type:complete len:248 (+) Transcript_7216:1024-1767(+)